MPSQFTYFLNKIQRTTKALLIPDSWNRAAFYLSEDYPGELEKRNGGIFFRTLDLFVSNDKFHFLLNAYPIARRLVEYNSVRFEIDGDSLFIFFGDLKLNPRTAEEIFIIQEIFLCGTYNFTSTDAYVVVDVGMNVALASLFFASKPNVRKVYAFEPFKPTFTQAVNNIALNPKLQEKIVASTYGLGGASEQIEVNYSYENKGQVGVLGTDLIRVGGFQSNKETIELVAADAALSKIMEMHPTEKLMLKVDCEGAEYAIFENLAASHLLKHVDVIFIEWHEKGPAALIDILVQNDFKVFDQRVAEKKVGMIYAIR